MTKLSETKKSILSGIILALFPIVSCFIWTLIQGGTLGSVWAGAGEWNDELFYFKQVECIVRDGMPIGYFGFDESHATIGTLGAWTPTLLLPWALFGKVFGWTYNSAYIANIFFLSVSLFLFAFLSELSIKKASVSFCLLLLFEPIYRYLLSGMAEIVCIAPLLVFLGLLLGYEKSKRKNTRFVLLLILGVILTLLRTYYVVVFAFAFALSEKKKGRIVATAGGTVVSVILSLEIFNLFTSPYFGDVYNTGIFSILSEQGLLGAVSFFFSEIFHYSYAILSVSLQGLRDGNGVGVYFGAFLVFTLLLLINVFALWKKKRQAAVFGICMVISHILLLLAIIFMYNLQDGFRHLAAFIVLDILLLAFYDEKPFIFEGSAVLIIVLFFILCGKNELYFKVPFDVDGGANRAEVYEMKEVLSSKMHITDELSWDNTVIVLFMDSEPGESGTQQIPWQYAYSIPEGFALSLCSSEYIYGNADSLKSRYIMVKAGGAVERNLQSRLEFLVGNDEVSFYRIIEGTY